MRPYARRGTIAKDKDRGTMRGRNFLKDQRAATAIEYGLIAALVAVASIVAFRMLGLTLSGVFNTINNALTGAP